ncbi:unnamed protein product, partial [Vitis vinifera]|uniref:ascorbate ferrireductase (transmembrane) n=1 Tax=Vitis vinifera TaxID=29760 RepID=D7T8G9_VITVI
MLRYIACIYVSAIMSCKAVQGKRRAPILVHLILHFIALVAGIFGVCMAFRYHHVESMPDMYTLHSWLGLCTICLFGLQWMFAFFSFWYPGVKKPRRRRLMPWHWFAGMVIFLMAILTAETGLVQRSTYLRRQEALIVNFTGLLILLFATAVGLSVIHPSCLPPKSGSDPVISFPELVIGLADVVLTSNDS